jgi:gamma-glutamylcyclotransferase (GGCT)/AIG2-like uncharacterized protein YtfP
MTVEHRFANYGSLAPGRVNHHQLAGREGTWRKGTVRGTLVESGWGAALGFPGLLLDEGGAAVGVLLFESLDLPDHWERLDAFEGAGYRRERAKISTPDGQPEAFISVLAP